jgi:hypothetical protein
VFAAAAGGLIPASLRGTSNSQLMHIADWYATFSTLAGVDPTDDWKDVNGTVHPIDGENLWPVLTQGANVKREWLPTTPQSILFTTGAHMWKLITLETQTVRFHQNGTNYADPFNPCTVHGFSTEIYTRGFHWSHACSLQASMRVTNCIPFGCSLFLIVATVNSVQILTATTTQTAALTLTLTLTLTNPNHQSRPNAEGINATTVFDCVDSLGEDGGGGRESCYVCTPEQPCLYDVLTDPGETQNVAKANPALVASMGSELAKFQEPIVFKMTLTPDNLACYNCSFNPVSQWYNYTGPGCIASKPAANSVSIE